MLLACLAFGVAGLRINHGQPESGLPPGAGLTIDESFNIHQGYLLYSALMDHGPGLFTQDGVEKVFGDRNYLPDHPPLGRLLLGIAHEWTGPFLSGAEETGFNVPAARLGSCFAFAITVLLLTEFARRAFDVRTAILAGLGLMLMPRVVGHARLAALETATSLAWWVALLPLLFWWTKEKPPTIKQAAVSGALWGLLLLTKVQGILFPPLVFFWAVWRFRYRAIVPLTVFGILGGLVFFAGWPWLWLDPMANIQKFLGHSAVINKEGARNLPVRPSLYAWYFGHRYTDKLVPWHYPFVMTLLTLPACVLVLLIARCVQRKFNTVEALLAMSAVWPIIVFSLPGTPVYDGTRLFLVVMPPLALLAARAIAVMEKRRAFLFVCGTLAVPAIMNVVSPFSMNSYSVLVGGTAGGQALGMEAGYWADGLNEEFWQQVPEGSTVYVAPVSHQFQLPVLEQMSPVVKQRRIRLEAFEYDADRQRGLLLLIHRLADLRPSLRELPAGARPVAESRHGSTVLARLIDTTDAEWDSVPDWPADLVD